VASTGADDAAHQSTHQTQGERGKEREVHATTLQLDTWNCLFDNSKIRPAGFFKNVF